MRIYFSYERSRENNTGNLFTACKSIVRKAKRSLLDFNNACGIFVCSDEILSDIK